MVRAIQDRTQPAIVGFEDRSSHKPKMPQSLEAGKGKEADSFLDSQKEHRSTRTLISGAAFGETDFKLLTY